VALGSDSTFSRGDRVDRFEIRELIAEGGMGAIYRAIDTRLQRMVALKVVRADRLDSSAGDQARQRFLREALAISKVDHRNVVRVLDFGFAGDTPYLAMEYLRGQDLGKLIKSTTGALPVAEVVDIMLAVCAAISACHDAGVIHRDLKPSNIFLCDTDSEREVKILDFGVSKPPIATAGDLTREGQIVGTPQYLAPEQVDGKAVPQTDQYAIGVMLYMCLTKALPYQNHASFGLLRAIVTGRFAPPRALRPELPEALEAIILRAMRLEPEDRFESVYALGRELWELGSPEAREQWRAYYLDERLRAAPKASTHAMPLIEAMARGLAVARPVREPEALASTVPDEPAGMQTHESIDLPPPVALPGAAPAPDGAPEKRRSTVALVAAGVVVLGAAGWLLLRRPVDGDPPKVGGPVTPVERPRVASPTVAKPLPTDPKPEPAKPGTSASPTPATTKRLRKTTSRAERAGRTTEPAHDDKQHPRNNPEAPAEQPPDGVGIMP
jgi:serine/threonine-protein kinase